MNHSGSDSDIVIPYGGVKRLTNTGDLSGNLRSFPSAEQMVSLQHHLAGKTGACLWRASHCWTDSNREDLVQQISSYINVTIIGKCANNEVWLAGGGVTESYFVLSDKE